VLALLTAAPLLAASAAFADEPEEEPLTAPRPDPPSGVACVVYGRGTGLEGSCSRRLTEVVSARAGGRPLARFQAEDIDVAWGIYRGRGRGWVHAEDGVLVLDGFADLAKEVFALRREVAVVEDHVWLKQSIPVHPMGADRDGIAVRVDDSFEGLAALAPHVPCESIVFDPPPDTSPAAAATTAPPLESTTPRFGWLSLHEGPGGKRLTTVRTAEQQLPLLLDVVERRDGWTRVRFETDYARFDAWSPTSQVDSEVGSLRGFGASGCSSCGIGASVRWYAMAQKTPIVVGVMPSVMASSGLVILEGASVRVGERRGRFVSITPASRIMPPEGAAFWVPADTIEGYGD
jgi:hypothetical protein